MHFTSTVVYVSGCQDFKSIVIHVGKGQDEQGGICMNDKVSGTPVSSHFRKYRIDMKLRRRTSIFSVIH